MMRMQIVGGDAAVAKLEEFPGVMRAKLRQAISKQAFDLQRDIQQNKLSGQVLRNRSNFLRNSIAPKDFETDTTIGSTVGTNVAYAAAHEYGFKGVVTVKAHLRTITQAFGKELKGGAKTISVKSHPMRMNLPMRSFLRSTLVERTDTIRNALTAAVAEAVAE